MSANWQWSIGPWRAGANASPALIGVGGPDANVQAATARSLKVRLLDPSEATFTISGRSLAALDVDELVTDLWVYRDGTALFRGRATKTTDSLGADDRYTLAVEFADYRGLLDRRLAYTDATYTAQDQSGIVSGVLATAQALPGGNLGLALGTGFPTSGVTRPSVIHKTGDSVWTVIRNLGRMQGGFDFDIDATLTAQLYHSQRGVSNGVVLDYGGVVSAAGRTFDTGSYANAVRQSGADSVAATTLTVTSIATTPEGRWDAQFGDTNLTTADMVAQVAQTNLNLASMPLPVYTLQLARGAWAGPGHVWVGDYVTVVLKAGRLNEQALARVYELDIDVGASNEETVTVVAGDVLLSPESVLRTIAKRLVVLSRR